MSFLLRYRRVADLITPIITHETQRRLDATLEELRAKAMAQSKDPEELEKRFNQALIDRVNELLAAENAWRIRQWTTRILEEERIYLEEIRTAETTEIAPLGVR